MSRAGLDKALGSDGARVLAMAARDDSILGELDARHLKLLDGDAEGGVSRPGRRAGVGNDVHDIAVLADVRAGTDGVRRGRGGVGPGPWVAGAVGAWAVARAWARARAWGAWGADTAGRSAGERSVRAGARHCRAGSRDAHGVPTASA